MKNKILIVEDDRDLRLLYGEELTLAGYAVTAVADADTAFATLKQRDFDLVITDIRMPGRSGIELIFQIMAAHKQVPIIIFTAFGSYRDNFMTWAADAFITKSSSLDELLAKIRELIG